MKDVWLITGPPGAGKTTVARLLAAKMDRAAHIEGDLLRRCIVTGGAWPGHGSPEEAERQAALHIRNQCLLARSFAEAAFVAVIDHFVADGRQMQEYRGGLTGLDQHVVVLAPAREVVALRDHERAAVHGHTHEDTHHLGDVMADELGDVGLWLDSSALSSEQTVAEILSRRAEARIRR